MAYEFFIAGRYLRTRQKQGFISFITLLSIAGVTVGVMALIVVIAVMAGFEDDLKTRILGVEADIVLKKTNGDLNDYKGIIEKLEKEQGVVSSTPFVRTQVMLKSFTGTAGARLNGIDPDSAGRVLKEFSGIALKDKFRQEKKTGLSCPGIILGKELAKNLGVEKGETVYLITPRGMLTPMGHMPAMKRFRVSGLFSSGMYEYDGSMAYVSLADAEKILHMGDKVSGIDILVADIYKAGEIGRKIISKLGPGFQAKDWIESKQSLFSALKLEKAVMFIILTLIIFVAAFNIASSLAMLVIKKTKDIGILKAMGATNKGIRKIFIFKGVAIGTLGTVIGTSLGTFLCFLLGRYRFVKLPADLFYITTIPVKLDIGTVLITALAAIVISLIATLYPASRAAGIEPVEAIRYG